MNCVQNFGRNVIERHLSGDTEKFRAVGCEGVNWVSPGVSSGRNLWSLLWTFGF